jgi:O-acetyl-ADP-ribose deacetylase (regulator of RNase III)
MSKELIVGDCVVCLHRGDITQMAVDAIVNAANSSLMGGGGVDGAIHRAGGPAILEECKKIPPGSAGRCPPGQAVATGAGNLKAKYVIHTVGPIWHGGKKGEEELLRRAYHNSLLRAEEHDCTSVAFPSISTGAYRFPIEKASHIAVDTIVSFLKERKTPREVVLVLFSERDYKVYDRIFDSLAQA